MTSNDTSVKICLVGASGRMGTEIIKALSSKQTPQAALMSIVGGIVAPSDPVCGKIIQGIKLSLSSKWEEEFNNSNLIVDFSSQDGTELALHCAKKRGIPLIIGTTGLGSTVQDSIIKNSKEIPILQATNFSVGMNLLFWLVGKAAKMLGSGFDAEIVEIHHRMKKDSPSGTALSLAEAIAKARGKDQNQVMRRSRDGKQVPRIDDEITVLGLRGGDVVGEHTVHFLGDFERLEFTHRATNRAVFALGALRAAAWIVNQRPGLYSMQDLLMASMG